MTCPRCGSEMVKTISTCVQECKRCDLVKVAPLQENVDHLWVDHGGEG